jgi:hypothetical protein
MIQEYISLEWPTKRVSIVPVILGFPSVAAVTLTPTSTWMVLDIYLWPRVSMIVSFSDMKNSRGQFKVQQGLGTIKAKVGC